MSEVRACYPSGLKIIQAVNYLKLRGIYQFMNMDRIASPNFGQPAQTSSSFKELKRLQVKNSFATIVNGLSILKLFQLSNADLLFS